MGVAKQVDFVVPFKGRVRTWYHPDISRETFYNMMTAALDMAVHHVADKCNVHFTFELDNEYSLEDQDGEEVD